MKKRIVFLLVIILCTGCSKRESFIVPSSESNPQTTTSSQTEQSTTESGIRLLSTPQDLLDFAKVINEQKQPNLENITWKLENDIDLTGIEWIPIGSVHWDDAGVDEWEKKGFGGTFDGNGHHITGLSVIGKEIYYTGFFGKLYGNAKISNLHIEGKVIGERMVGGLAGGAGSSDFVIIENCSFTGTVSALSNEVGGFMGATGENTRIENCYANVEVAGSTGVGGFVGNANNASVILNSYCHGTVSTKSIYKMQQETGIKAQEQQIADALEKPTEGEISLGMIGGFAGGTFNASIKNCYSNVTVKAYETARMLGAFIGYYSGNDANCYYNQQINEQWTIGYAYPGTNTSFTAMGCNTDQLKIQNNFQQWDFDTIWEMDQKTQMPALQSSNTK